MTDELALRKKAIRRLERKRAFAAHARVYAAVNALLILIWAFTGGFFWPIFPILGWGIGLSAHAWDTYRRTSFSEDEVRREIERLRR